MATKYSHLEVGDPLAKMVDEITEQLGLTNIIDFEVLLTDKGKAPCKVVKANELTEYISKRNDLVFIIVREDLFYELTERSKYLLLRAVMDRVSFDSDKDKVIIDNGGLSVPVGAYEAYGTEIIDAMLQAMYTIVSLDDAKKNNKKKGKTPQQAE